MKEEDADFNPGDRNQELSNWAPNQAALASLGKP